MTTHVAFLRAINVGGRAVVTMDLLRASFAAAGCANVRSCIQSGNVLFECSDRASAATFRRIQAELGSLLSGSPVVVYGGSTPSRVWFTPIRFRRSRAAGRRSGT